MAKQMIWESPEVRRKMNSYGINIIPSNFYSTVPSVDEIENSFEYRTDADIYNTGIFDYEEIRQFTMALSAYSSEFDPPIEGDKEMPPATSGRLRLFVLRRDGILLRPSAFQAESDAGGRIGIFHTDCGCGDTEERRRDG